MCSEIYKEIIDDKNYFYIVLYKHNGSVLYKELAGDVNEKFKLLPNNFFGDS